MTFPTVGARSSAQVGIPSVRLSVVPRVVRVARGIQWGLLSLTIGAGLFTGWMWWDRQALNEEADRYASAVERTESFNRQFTAQLEQGRLRLSAQQMAEIKDEVLFINQLAEKRRFSWTQLLHDLEEALPTGISIVKIQRDVKQATITIDGRATGMTALNTLMFTLQSRVPFRLPVLHHHKFADSHRSDGGVEGEAAGVEFSLTVQYGGLPEKAHHDDVS